MADSKERTPATVTEHGETVLKTKDAYYHIVGSVKVYYYGDVLKTAK